MTPLLDVPLPRRLHGVPVVPWLHGRLAERAWSWDLRDQWTRAWWPQGITWAGPLLLVSWYARAGGSRVSVVDLESRRYGHVTLLRPDGAPLKVHAGGLAYVDGWLHVAATARGFWSLHVDDLCPTDGRAARSASDERRRDPASWRVRRLHRPALPGSDEPFRWSFLDASGGGSRLGGRAASASERRRDPGTHLYAGEYGRGQQTTRLARLALTDGLPSGDLELLGTGPRGMQGVVATEAGLVTSTSAGPWTRGTIYRLSPAEPAARPSPLVEPADPQRSSTLVEPAERQRGRVETPQPEAAPIGVEDLTTDDCGQLWTASEHPGRRAIVGLSLV